MRDDIGCGARDQIACAPAAAAQGTLFDDAAADLVQRFDELRHAVAVERRRFEYRNFLGNRGSDRQRADELLHRLLGARPVTLVDDDDVGDFEQSRLHRLDVVAEAGR